MIEVRQVNQEVFVAKDSIVAFGDEELEFVKKAAAKSERGRARICAHHTSEDLLHEMLIAITPRSYIRPHRHLEKSESFHVVEGIVDVIVFSENGDITKIIELGEPGSGRSFFYRMSESKFHTLLIHSQILVVHEVTNGPFRASTSVMAGFAPMETDLPAAQRYVEELLQQNFAFKRDQS